MITPTVGRVLHYYPAKEEAVCRNGTQPHACLIATVINNRLVNLTCFDSEGRQYHRKHVTLIQPEDDTEVPYDQGHCQWIPFQVGQSQAVKEAQEKGGVKDSSGGTDDGSRTTKPETTPQGDDEEL